MTHGGPPPLRVAPAVNSRAPLLFTANDCLDVGIALRSPVSLDYFAEEGRDAHSTWDSKTALPDRRPRVR